MALRWLIVDDNPGFLRAASALLENGGIRVIGTASTSSDALRTATALAPDVMLVDVDLDGESGFGLVRRLSSEPGLRPGCLILVSAHAEEDLAELVEASPAIGFLSKSALSAAAIERLIRGTADAGGPPGPSGQGDGAVGGQAGSA